MSSQEAVDEDDDRPYCERPEWNDMEPVPQVDGPEPLVVIRYPKGFDDVHSYFRAVQQRVEFSLRALRLTADVIEQNSANYTAWYYRRRCLKELGSDLAKELAFADTWGRNSPKNYQVWFHRRWLIAELTEHLRQTAASKEEGDKQVITLAKRELEFLWDVMQENEDYKNYNGWSHRQFVVQRFGLWEDEMSFVEELIDHDIRNNSAWNHRFAVVRNLSWPPSDAVRQREVQYVLSAVRLCVGNESAWNYLSAFLGDGPDRAAWDSDPSLEAFCREVLAQTADKENMCRFAIETLARVHEAKCEVAEAKEQYALLKEVDKIRADYWDWRASLLGIQQTQSS